MRFRFHVTDGGQTFDTPWVDDGGNLSASIRVINDLRLLYPQGVFVLEQILGNGYTPEQLAAAQTQWLAQAVAAQIPIIDGGLI